MLPMEVVVPSLRISKHNGLNPQEYIEAMMMELEALDGKRLQALNHIMIQKKKVARAYNKRVRRNNFEEGELIWKVVLPIDAKTESWGNGLLTGRDHSRFTKDCSKMPTGYQSLKECHTKGSSMKSTSINACPQCGKCWILPRKTKMVNEGNNKQK